MANLALLTWPVFALILFAWRPPLQALTWSVLLPYLFLPEAISIPLPGLPDLSKTLVISVGVLMGLVLFRSKFQPLLHNRPKQAGGLKTIIWLCLFTIVIGSVFTVMSNGEVLRFADRIIPAARPWDIVSLTGVLVIGLVPFLAGMRYLATGDAHRVLLYALAIGTLGYSLPMLIEIRLSPQLHFWVYGYYQHEFIQHIRDGFRPMMFLQHGLWVGFLVFMGLMAALGLWRAEKKAKWLLAGLWILAVLSVSENLGALAIALVMIAVLLTLGQRAQIAVLACVAIVTLAYPALRQAQLLPLDRVVSLAADISTSRAASLQFRLDNEDLLLERASLKPMTGWGGWNRSRVFDEDGRNLSVTDGRWIIVLGEYGWIGYLGYFGLLTLPIMALLAIRRHGPIPIETMTLALIASGNLIYMLPNATLTPVGLMVFGAVAGFCSSGYKARASKEDSEEDSTEREETKRGKKQPRYTRFGKKIHTRPRIS